MGTFSKGQRTVLQLDAGVDIDVRLREDPRNGVVSVKALDSNSTYKEGDIFLVNTEKLTD